MSEPPASPNAEEFAEWVHDALNHLYDSTYLQTHPLARVLADAETSFRQPSQDLRRVLLKAIRAMRPCPGTPAQSADWRGYRILELRYIEGLSPAEVMDQIALGRSQYFREQARALQGLTAALWNQLHRSRTEAIPTTDESGTTREELAQSEMERLRAQAKWEVIDIVQLLDDLRPVLDTLAKKKGVSTRFSFPYPLKTLRADRVILRQTLINVITYALDMACEGHVEVSSFLEKTEMGICIMTRPSVITTSWEPIQQRHGVGLDISEELLMSMGGRLRVEARPGDQWKACLVWPVSKPPVLLIVDDNEKFADLCRRYLAGYDWQVISAVNGAEAHQIIGETRLTAIVLDVMMPNEDGWEMLIALKANNSTHDIPIIVCSVLNEPQLALALGAVAYLTKPMTQKALLQALTLCRQPRANPGPTP